jgi:SAM-dependent methyltransferase
MIYLRGVETQEEPEEQHMEKSSSTQEDHVRSLPGTHEIVVEKAKRFAVKHGTALDLGAWSGALTELLQDAGFVVTAADIQNHLKIPSTFIALDFNDPHFDSTLSERYDLITSVEVIEHLESPTAFLRCISRLLKPGGIAIVTTPNVENVAARIKFFLNGRLRAMDEMAPEHITPIHLDLFLRQILPKSGLELVERSDHPKGDFPLTSRRYFIPIFRFLSIFLKGPALTGDCHIFVLKKA